MTDTGKEGMIMNIAQAENIVKGCWSLDCPSEEDLERCHRALDFLVDRTGDPEWMLEAGGWYYREKDFEKAVYYYTLSAERGNVTAMTCLGYAYMYGNGVDTDYPRAFRYYSSAASCGDLTAAYKVADMYMWGMGVEEDRELAADLIRQLYEKVKDLTGLAEPVPQIFVRMAELVMEQKGAKRVREAKRLLSHARSFLARRLSEASWWGDIRVMQRIIDDWYRLVPFDYSEFDLYDLMHLLREPVTVTFLLYGEKYSVTSSEGGIGFEGKGFSDIEDFFYNASVDEEKLTSAYYDIYMLGVEYE